jgi:hypothetical protein
MSQIFRLNFDQYYPSLENEESHKNIYYCKCPKSKIMAIFLHTCITYKLEIPAVNMLVTRFLCHFRSRRQNVRCVGKGRKTYSLDV